MNQEKKACTPGGGELGTSLSAEELEMWATVLKALAHPVRLRMVDLIYRSGGDTCVCEFEAYFDLKQPPISHHLKILRDAGLIRSRQDGTWVRHSIETAGFLLRQRPNRHSLNTIDLRYPV